MFGFNFRPLHPTLPLIFQLSLLGATLSLFVAGCDENSDPAVEKATTLDVKPGSAALVEGDSVQMNAIPRDSQGSAVSGYRIAWASEDSAVATVDTDGTVVAQNLGSATITATAKKKGAESLSDQSNVTVERPQGGALEVSASTSGSDPDPDGYTATVDDSTAEDIGPNGSATFSDLSEGDHSVKLSGIASNCSVDGSNPKTVSVTAGNTASTSFSVSCTATTGSLDVTASTSGDDPDPDGYTATVDGSSSQDLGLNGTVTFSGLSEGDHSVELSGIASNCSVDGSNLRTVTVQAGSTVSTTFNVSCDATGLPEVAVPSEGDWSSPTTVLEPGPSGAWDERLAGPAPASIIKKDGTYYLYYIGAAGDRSSDGGPAKRAVGLATSTDGDTWTKHSSNPVISWSELENNNDGEEGAWGVAAYVDGDEIILYVSDLVGSGGTVDGDIRLFTSTDGVNLTDQGIVVDHANYPGTELTPTGIYQDDGGTWHLYYLAADYNPDWGLVHVTGSTCGTFDSASATVIRDDAGNGNQNRFGGDVVVLKDDDTGEKIGLTSSFNGGGIEYLTFTSPNFGDDTLEETYDFGHTERVAHYLDRDAGQWLILSGQGEDDLNAINLRTAPVQSP